MRTDILARLSNLPGPESGHRPFLPLNVALITRRRKAGGVEPLAPMPPVSRAQVSSWAGHGGYKREEDELMKVRGRTVGAGDLGRERSLLGGHSPTSEKHSGGRRWKTLKPQLCQHREPEQTPTHGDPRCVSMELCSIGFSVLIFHK